MPAIRVIRGLGRFIFVERAAGSNFSLGGFFPALPVGHLGMQQEHDDWPPHVYLPRHRNLHW